MSVDVTVETVIRRSVDAVAAYRPTAQGPFPMETIYTWSPAGDGCTRMTLRNRGEPSWFSQLVTPFMARAVKRANHKDLAKLKSILEAH